MTGLILKRANSSRPGNINWGDNDYDVLDSGKVAGRIMLHPQAPEDRSWFWTITARAHTPSIHSRGYSATREEAMAEFKAQWLS